jgi:hypothetical protein
MVLALSAGGESAQYQKCGTTLHAMLRQQWYTIGCFTIIKRFFATLSRAVIGSSFLRDRNFALLVQLSLLLLLRNDI